MKVYLSHEFGGKEVNILRVESIIKRLYNDNASGLMKNNITFVSPLHALGFMYDVVPYEEGMRMCLDLLEDCDLMVYFEGYDKSIGVVREKEFCRKMDILTLDFTTFMKMIEQ